MVSDLTLLKAARDPVIWAEIHVPSFKLDPWQKKFVRQIANPPALPDGDIAESFTLRSARQMGKSTVLGLIGAYWADVRRPMRRSNIDALKGTITAELDKGSGIAYFASSIRQASSTMRNCIDFLRAAGIQLSSDSEESVVTAGGSRILALPATSTARGESLQLAVLDEAGHLEHGGEGVFGVVTPMLSSFANTALIMSSTPGAAHGLYYKHVSDPIGNRTILTDVSVSENPRISGSFLRSEKARMGQMHFASEYHPDGGTHIPPSFWEDGRGLFQMSALRASVTGEVEALEVPEWL
jgi:hypothetical protein